MIQFATPSVANATPSVADQRGCSPAERPETGEFARVLARQDDQGEPARPAARQPDDNHPAPPAPDAAAPEPAEPGPAVAARLPEGGKILPATRPDPAAPAELPQLPEGPDPAAQTIPALLAAVRAIRVNGGDEPAATPGKAAQAASPGAGDGDGDGDTATDAEATGAGDAAAASPVPTTIASLVAALAVPAAALTVPPQAATAPQSQAATGAAPGNGAAPQSATDGPALPPAIAAQMAGQPLPAPSLMAPTAPLAQDRPVSADFVLPATTLPQAADPALALKIDPASQPPLAAALSLEAAPAKPMAGVRLRPIVEARTTEARTAEAATTSAASSDPLGQLAGSFGTGSPLAPTPALTGTAPVSRPHDFAGLVDRLIAARDAAQTGLPQTVHMSVNHAEFGQISLNFQHDQGGLAVSVASADPDFARAVQAAIPSSGADSTSRDARQGAGQPGAMAQAFARGDTATGSDAGQRQQRGAAAFAADGRPQAANPSRDADEAGARPRGIFA